ncbi:MAG: glutathionylspermidine synthase family protein [Phycisphaerales bacterium]|nr:glutathionylspermidine synthase family protein [Phycisphaerales bacterium]
MSAISAFDAMGLACTREMSRDEVVWLRSKAIFHAGKVDPQMFDGPALAPFAMVLSRASFTELFGLAERAWQELIGVESAVIACGAAAFRRLTVPRQLRRQLRVRPTGSKTIRVARFDFHPTASGWRVSEINADVPGGYIEAGPITRLAREVMCLERVCDLPMDPLQELASAVEGALACRVDRGEREAAGGGGRVALLHATAYTDDWSVMRAVQRALAERGIESVLASPAHLGVDDLRAVGRRVTVRGVEVSAVLRFFPAEWLCQLPGKIPWREVYQIDDLIVGNPLEAIVLQSKRLPLLIEEMKSQHRRGGPPVKTAVWDALLPRTRAIGSQRWKVSLIPDEGWALKPVWGRVGEGIVIQGVTKPRELRAAVRSARLFPSSWLLQERFESRAVQTPVGPRHVCLGVYVINGKAAGIYARASEKPLIDARAQDVPTLIERDGGGGEGGLGEGQPTRRDLGVRETQSEPTASGVSR